MRFDWTINPTNLLTLVVLIVASARWTVGKVLGQIHRIDLHEAALMRAGWLKKNRRGQLEVADRQGV